MWVVSKIGICEPAQSRRETGIVESPRHLEGIRYGQCWCLVGTPSAPQLRCLPTQMSQSQGTFMNERNENRWKRRRRGGQEICKGERTYIVGVCCKCGRVSRFPIVDLQTWRWCQHKSGRNWRHGDETPSQEEMQKSDGYYVVKHGDWKRRGGKGDHQTSPSHAAS